MDQVKTVSKTAHYMWHSAEEKPDSMPKRIQ